MQALCCRHIKRVIHSSYNSIHNHINTNHHIRWFTTQSNIHHQHHQPNDSTLSIDTLLVNSSYPADLHGEFSPVSAPLYQTATFSSPSSISSGVYDYTRSGNPTRTMLQTQLARIEHANHAYVFTSGMAALTIVTQLIEGLSTIVCGSDSYGGTIRLLSKVTGSDKICHFVDLCNLDELEAALKSITPKVAMIMAESPTNPLMRIIDIEAVSRVAHKYNVLLCIDNTMMSPYLQRPLALGADVVMHSATKFISGHSDVMAGVLATNDPHLSTRIAFLQNATGNALAPFDSWLLLRGIKTLGVRMRQQQETAQKIAKFLSSHSLVNIVYYAGLSTHPGHELHAKQSTGPGSVISFETKSDNISRHFVDSLRLFKRSVSFGGVTSSIELPFYFSHASVPSALRADNQVSHVSQGLIRISIGLEDYDDLIVDMQQAFTLAEKAVQSSP